MTILFYLPAIIPRWFERLFVPLIERLAVAGEGEHQIHILAPAPWKGTGLGEAELALCAHLGNVHYHIVNDADHPSMRTQPAQRDAIIAFVRALAPDYTLCRSADFETTRGFPGIVRHITEGGADPLILPLDTVHFTKAPFDHGVLPDLSEAQIMQLDRLIAPFWERLKASSLGTPHLDHLRDWAQLPTDRPVLFVPLEYEDAENFFAHHRATPRPNAKWVEELAKEWGTRVFFALTNHPLNIARLDNSELSRTVASHRDCMRLYPYKTPLGTPTAAFLTSEADAMLVGDSKMFALAAALGTPLVRQSRFETAHWLKPYATIGELLDDLSLAQTGKGARSPDPDMARAWFAFHTANNLINFQGTHFQGTHFLGTHLQDPQFTGEEILARLENPLDPSRWERNFAFFAEGW